LAERQSPNIRPPSYHPSCFGFPQAVDLLRVFELSSSAGDALVDADVLREVQKLLSVLDVASAATAGEHSAALEQVIAASNEGGYVGLFAPFVSVSNFGGLKNFLEEAYAQKAKSMTAKNLEGPIISELRFCTRILKL
jgi:hypothetical protein